MKQTCSTRVGSRRAPDGGHPSLPPNRLEDKEITDVRTLRKHCAEPRRYLSDCSAKRLAVQIVKSRTPAAAGRGLVLDFLCRWILNPEEVKATNTVVATRAQGKQAHTGIFKCSDPQSWSHRPVAVRAIRGNPRGPCAPEQPQATAGLVSGAGGPTNDPASGAAEQREVKSRTQRACEGN